MPPDPTPAPIRKRKRQKPKLTPELLLVSLAAEEKADLIVLATLRFNRTLHAPNVSLMSSVVGLQRETDGLPIVYLTFAERFREQYKGKGHEVSCHAASLAVCLSCTHIPRLAVQGSSLRRLLQMYERWQHRLIPSMQFDDFLAAAEKIGNTMEWKVISAGRGVSSTSPDTIP